MNTTDQISACAFSTNESRNGAICDAPGPAVAETSLLLETVFRKACRWVEQNYREPALGPDAIARNVRCSRATLYRAFQARGLTVSGYIRRVRLEQVRARFSIAAPRIPISAIAFDCGFECLRHFNRSFKAAFGSTAGQLRAMLFGGNANLDGSDFG